MPTYRIVAAREPAVDGRLPTGAYLGSWELSGYTTIRDAVRYAATLWPVETKYLEITEIEP